MKGFKGRRTNCWSVRAEHCDHDEPVEVSIGTPVERDSVSHPPLEPVPQLLSTAIHKEHLVYDHVEGSVETPVEQECVTRPRPPSDPDMEGDISPELKTAWDAVGAEMRKLIAMVKKQAKDLKQAQDAFQQALDDRFVLDFPYLRSTLTICSRARADKENEAKLIQAKLEHKKQLQSDLFIIASLQQEADRANERIQALRGERSSFTVSDSEVSQMKVDRDLAQLELEKCHELHSNRNTSLVVENLDLRRELSMHTQTSAEKEAIIQEAQEQHSMMVEGYSIKVLEL